MNNRKSRRVIHSRKNKLLRKINTKNLLLAGSLLSLGALTTHQLDAIYAETPNEIITYLQSENASSFEGKEDLLNELMLEEIKKAQESQSEEWKENTAEDIKAEIERQKELGLEAYVVQWGDTLEMLAEATEQTVDYLVEINQLDEDQDLLVGDLLTGILETVEDEGQRITELPGLVQTGNNTITQPVQPAKPVVITEVKEITVTEGIDFEEIKRDNLDLFVGESKLIQKGQLGEKALLYKVTYHNGKEVNRELLSQEIVKEAIAEIVEIGTKDKIESFQEVETTEILFKTVKEESDELLKGETRVAQEGINGKAQLVYKVTVTNGKETARELIRQETSQEAIDKIIKIGTKVEVTYKNETINESIPFETIERDNGELEIGESKVLQEGKEGIKSKVYKVTYHNGKEVSRELVEEEVSVAPVNKIIEKGTKEPVVEYVTVEFRDNHGILGEQLKSIKVKKGDTLTLPTEGFSSSYIKLTGWADSSKHDIKYEGLEANYYDNNTPITEDIVLYPQWLSKFHIDFRIMTPQDMKDTGISYGNDAFPKESIVLWEGEKFYGKLPQLPKTEGFELWGWKVYADRYEAHILENSLAEEIAYAENDLFPNWVYNANPLPSLEEDEVYVFLENIQMNDDTDWKNLAFAIKRGESFDLSDYGPGDEYVMEGWRTGDSLHTSESIVVNENIYLSQSRRRKMTVNLYTGPEELMTSFDALEWELLGELPTPSKDNYLFKGWKDSNGYLFDDQSTVLYDESRSGIFNLHAWWLEDEDVIQTMTLDSEEISSLENVEDLANESEVSDDVVEEASALEVTSVLEEIVELDNEVINEEDMDVINQESVSETENLTN